MTLLTIENTALVADSTCDPPDGYFDREGFAIVPLKVHFGDETYRDLLDLAPPQFFAKLIASSALPTTSQPTAAEFEACYAKLLERYDHVFSFHLSRLMSGTYETAAAVAGTMPGVEAYDTRSASTLITLIVGRVRARLEQGIEAAELRAYIEHACTVGRMLFQVSTLEYLRRGGRIGRASSIVGDMLGIRPLIHTDQGELAAYAKVRGERRALETMSGYLEKYSRPEDTIYLCLFHADNPDGVVPLGECLLAVRPRAQVLFTGIVGAIVGTHCGPGTFAFGMIVE